MSAEESLSLIPVSAQLKRGGNGTVSFVVIRDAGAREYEIELPGKYAVSAEIAGGIKAVEGITDVKFN